MIAVISRHEAGIERLRQELRSGATPMHSSDRRLRYSQVGIS